MQEDLQQSSTPSGPEPDLPVVKHNNSYMAAQSANSAPANGTNLEDDKVAPIELSALGQEQMTEEERREADMEAREKDMEHGF